MAVVQNKKERVIKWLMIGGIILVGVYIFYRVLVAKQQSAASSTTASTAGGAAAGAGTLEYIPTSTTDVGNLNYAAQGDAAQYVPIGTPPGGGASITTPGGVSIQTTPATVPQNVVNATATSQSSPGPVTINGPTVSNSGAPVTVVTNTTPPRPTPVPVPPVSVHPSGPPISPAPSPKYYTVVGGDTLSAIAGRFHTTWQNLFSVNKSLIVNTANQHGNPIPGGAQNNIFPGERLLIPS